MKYFDMKPHEVVLVDELEKLLVTNNQLLKGIITLSDNNVVEYVKHQGFIRDGYRYSFYNNNRFEFELLGLSDLFGEVSYFKIYDDNKVYNAVTKRYDTVDVFIEFMNMMSRPVAGDFDGDCLTIRDFK